MMEYSIVNFSEIDLGNRIDAEYFQPTYLDIEEKLLAKKSRPLREYSKDITGSAFYPAATQLYEIGDLPFIRCVDCISFPTITKRQDYLFEKIPTSFANEHKNIKQLSKGDIVITKVGTPCFASIIHDIDKVALSRTVLGLRKIQGINPYYLTIFLRSKYGFYQLYRERELTIQYQLTLERVGNILIYKPENELLENNIAGSLRKYEEILDKSEILYHQAQNLLLSELGLLDWKPKHQLSFVKNFSDTQEAGRIDAEYFQPKYEEIVKAIKSYSGGWDTLDNILNIKDKNFSPEEGVVYKYIELANIGGNGEITGCTEAEGQELPTRARRKATKGDVIISSIEGSLSSVALITEEYDGALCSTGFYVVDSDELNSETLLVLLKSHIGQLQLKKGCNGTILTAINKDELEKIVLPKIDDDLQKEIKQKIKESFKLRKQSKHLLEAAKRAVEIAIEEDEDTAMEWLNKEVGELNA